MKYCAQCGNPMGDDMIFCQKCGTKFESVLASAQESIEEKVARMKKYNLVLEAKSITWEFLQGDDERAKNFAYRQSAICDELVELIKEILAGVNDADRDFVEREVYTFVLQMGCRMCEEAGKMFANYSGLRELYDRGNRLCMAGQLDYCIFVDQVLEQDIPYRYVVGVQGLYVSRIKEVLDKEVIYHNLEFRNLTKQLAVTFNRMMSRQIKRNVDFCFPVGKEVLRTHWDLYTVMLEGLPLSIIEDLDESEWMMALDYEAENYSAGKFKWTFLKNRTDQREMQRKKEQEIEQEQYWLSHPDAYKQLEENKKRIAEIQKSVSSLNKEIRSLEEDITLLQEKKTDIEKRISDKRQLVEKLNKKVFGKKKAEGEVQALDKEIVVLEQELQDLSEKISTAEKPISNKKLERSNLKEEIERLEQENIDLCNK